MRTIFTSLIIIALFITGCKKNSNSKSNIAKTYLISKVTISTIPAGFTTTESYTYDSQNRVIQFGNYKYTYDNNNNLITVQTYSNGSLIATDNYSYSGSTVTANTFDGDGTANGSYTFTLNAQQHVISLSADDQQFTYDSNGNVTSYTANGTLKQSDSYTYDKEKSPRSMIGAKNLHMIYLAQGAPVTNINNVLVDHIYPVTYTYNY